MAAAAAAGGAAAAASTPTDVASLMAVIGDGILMPQHVLNCYVLGSTGIDGASTAASDTDAVLVVRDDAPPLGGKWRNQQWLRTHGWIANASRPGAFTGFRRDYTGRKGDSAGGVEFDVWIYTESSWRQLGAEGAPFAVECECLRETSPAAVWRRGVALNPPWCDPGTLMRSFCAVSLLHLFRAGLEFAGSPDHGYRPQRKLACSALKTEPWDEYKSKKTLFFALRLLEYARQLLRHGKIVDRAAVLKHKAALLGVAGGWPEHMGVFESLHASAVRALEEVWAASNPEEEPLDVMCRDEPWLQPPPARFACGCAACAAR